MSAKNQFSSRLAVILASVGSAVGLGNVWRFPAEVQSGGGAAFLLIYIACVFILGIPMMVAETSLGRAGRTDAVGVFRKLSPSSKWWISGIFMLLTAELILSFYMVVTGWTVEYIAESVNGNLYSGLGATPESVDNHFVEIMGRLVLESVNPLVASIAVIVINAVILAFGVQKGIERLSNLLMPILFVVLLVFCCVSLSLPGSGAGLEFFLKPDFSKVTTSVCLSALGQAFFSLSLGMGVFVTYAGYFPQSSNLVRTAVSVSLLDMLVAVLMGLIIFPAVMSFGLDGHSTVGTALVFVTMPEVFSRMPLSAVWSALFFFLLFVAAITATISIGEVIIRFLQDRCHMSRIKACVTAHLPLLVLCPLCSLSLGDGSGLRFFGMSLFDLFDSTTSNIMLPLCALCICIYIGWCAPKGLLESEITNGGSVNGRICRVLVPVIRYLAPALILIVLLTPLFN